MKNSYDNQALFAYILGLLPDGDIDRLDEKTFTDTDFAESVNAAEAELADLYANGELSGEMLEQFESRYMASPIRRKKVLFAGALREFVEKQATAEPRTLIVQPGRDDESNGKIAVFLGWITAWRGGLRAFQFAGALVVLLLIGAGVWLVLNGLRGRSGGNEVASTTDQNSVNEIGNVQITASPAPTVGEIPKTNVKPETTPAPTPRPKSNVSDEPRPQVAMITLLPPVRGGEKLPQLELRQETEAAGFTIKLDSADYGSYKVELVDQNSGKAVWQARSVKPGKSGTSRSLSVTIPAKFLHSNIYSFTVSGIASNGSLENIGDYPFRVMR